MPGVVRQDDPDEAGHTPKEFSLNVKVNGKGVFRHGDLDTNDDVVNAGSAQNETSFNVFANGQPIVLEGDRDFPSDDLQDTASGNVFIGS